MSDKKKVNVRIYGSDYTIVGTESEEYINNVCFAVDKKMREIGLNPALKPMKISVLAAVNMCDEYFKTKEMYERALSELDKCREELAAAEIENNTLKEEKRFLKDEIQSYRKSESNE